MHIRWYQIGFAAALTIGTMAPMRHARADARIHDGHGALKTDALISVKPPAGFIFTSEAGAPLPLNDGEKLPAPGTGALLTVSLAGLVAMGVRRRLK